MRSITLTIFHGKGYINSPNFSPNTSLIKVLISFILSEKEKSIGRTILSLHSLLSTFTKNIALEKVLTQRLQVASAPQLVIFVLTLQMTTGAEKTWTGGAKLRAKQANFF